MKINMTGRKRDRIMIQLRELQKLEEENVREVRWNHRFRHVFSARVFLVRLAIMALEDWPNLKQG